MWTLIGSEPTVWRQRAMGRLARRPRAHHEQFDPVDYRLRGLAQLRAGPSGGLALRHVPRRRMVDQTLGAP